MQNLIGRLQQPKSADVIDKLQEAIDKYETWIQEAETRKNKIKEKIDELAQKCTVNGKVQITQWEKAGLEMEVQNFRSTEMELLKLRADMTNLMKQKNMQERLVRETEMLQVNKENLKLMRASREAFLANQDVQQQLKEEMDLFNEINQFDLDYLTSDLSMIVPNFPHALELSQEKSVSDNQENEALLAQIQQIRQSTPQCS